MAGIKNIRKRISSVKNTRQITRAMKLVAAAKLRRAQDAITMARPYAVQLQKVIGRVAMRNDEKQHVLLQRREEKKVKLVVLTSDRGLCGGFNANIIRRTVALARELDGKHEVVEIDFIGRKGRDLLKNKLPAYVKLGKYWDGIFSSAITYSVAMNIANAVVDHYVNGEFDAVYFIYNEFKSAISQVVSVDKLLPIPQPQTEPTESVMDYVYEPGRKEILDAVVPRYFAVQVYRALLESVASEHGARMSAMDSATKNAEEMIRKLTLLHNRMRQAGITKELMEIVSGAEAQKA